MSDTLTDLVRENVHRQVPPDAQKLAQQIAAEHGRAVSAILFYGSCLRNQTVEGVLDFYVLVDDYKSFYVSRASAAANALLPPTVTYRDEDYARAKLAVISVSDLQNRMQPSCADTTLWARFCQPSALLYSRDADASRVICETIADAIATAVEWARRLTEEPVTNKELWTDLFKHTYGAELRVEDGKNRSATIYAQSPEYFDTLVAPAIAHAREKHDRKKWDSETHPKDRYQHSWRRKRLWGKVLNISRLFKASFTFEQKVEYIQWKVERHTGEPLVLSNFQKRFPLLNAPVILWRLWRKGIIR